MFLERCESAIEYCESVFHRLWHKACANENQSHSFDDGSVEISGVRVPAYVVEELQRLGISLSAYNPGELQAAIMACSVDRKLVDDVRGDNFLDMLELHKDEEHMQHALHTDTPNPFYDRPMSFCERLKQETLHRAGCDEEPGHGWSRSLRAA
jgi:hypothetical protein